MNDTVIIADPPWMMRGAGKVKRGADRHYELMPTSEIAALAEFVKGLAGDDAFLFLWTTNNHLPDALEVMRAWGFQYRTNIAWVKESIGMGFYTRGQHELCLIGVRGRPPRSMRGRYKGDAASSVIQAEKRAHSQKPDALHDIAWSFGTRRVELFARRRTPGWECYGDELLLTPSPDHSS